MLDPLLGSRGQLGPSSGRHRRLQEGPRIYFREDDDGAVLLFSSLHEIRLESDAEELFVAPLSHDQRSRSTYPRISSHQTRTRQVISDCRERMWSDIRHLVQQRFLLNAENDIGGIRKIEIGRPSHLKTSFMEGFCSLTKLRFCPG